MGTRGEERSFASVLLYVLSVHVIDQHPPKWTRGEKRSASFFSALQGEQECGAHAAKDIDPRDASKQGTDVEDLLVGRAAVRFKL